MQRVVPALRVASFKASRAFYERLGFEVAWTHQRAAGQPMFASLTRGDLEINLTEHSGDCAFGGLCQFYIGDVDAFHDDLTGAGVPIESAPGNDLGPDIRDMLIVDPDGNRLSFLTVTKPEMRRERDANVVVSGGCLCGAVRYEVYGPFLRAGHCHCSRCRRHSGTAVSTQGRVRREDFRLVRGVETITTFHPNDGSVKAFCNRCGSSLFGGTWPEGSEVSIRLGSVDGDPGIRPQDHAFVASRAPWDEITDDLPQHDGARPTATSS